jgi:hypothetical protein
MKNLIVAIALILPWCANGQDDRAQGIEELYGSWEVTGNSLDESYVQAYYPDDPKFMGARLQISESKVVLSYKNGEADEVCNIPEFISRSPHQFDIMCSNGFGFAPNIGEPSMIIDRSGMLTINWFDNVNLYLKQNQ